MSKNNSLQKRFVPLQQFSIGEEDSRGSFKGYGNVKGVVDSYGTLMIDGVYTKSIPSLLENGFIPDTHSAADDFVYTLRTNCGFFTNAVEDDKGLYLEAVYHSDEDSQKIRTKVKERLEAKKSMGLSVGFYKVRSFFINQKDYATELPKYVKAEYLSESMLAAKNFNSIEIIQEIDIIEVSLTTTPANGKSQVISARSGKNMDDNKPKFEPRISDLRTDYMGGNAEKNASVSALYSLVSDLFYYDFYTAVYDDEMPLEDRSMRLGAAIDEFKECVLSVHSALCGMSDDESADQVEQMCKDIRTIFPDPKSFSSLTGLSNKEQGVATLTAVKNYLNRQISLTELRLRQKSLGLRAGKAVSEATYNQVKSIRDDIMDCHENYCDVMSEHMASMDDFLSKYDPSVAVTAESSTNGQESETENEKRLKDEEAVLTTRRLMSRNLILKSKTIYH